MFLLLFAASAPVLGEAADALNRVRRLVDSLEFETAIEELEMVLRSDVSASQRVEALELMAVLHYNLDRRPLAQQTYERLLAMDPGHELRDTSYAPPVIQYFQAIQESFLPQQRMTITAAARQDPPDGGPVRVEASIDEDPGGVDRALVLVRGRGESSYRRAVMRRQGLVFTAQMPDSIAADTLEFYVEIQAPSGYVLGRVGTAENPRGLDAAPTPVEWGAVGAEIPPPEIGGGEVEPADPGEGQLGDGGEDLRPRRPFYRTWWFWTIIGVAVAGGTTAAVVLTRPEDQEAGTLGTRSLP